jgi:hypothetical protein
MKINEILKESNEMRKEINDILEEIYKILKEINKIFTKIDEVMRKSMNSLRISEWARPVKEGSGWLSWLTQASQCRQAGPAGLQDQKLKKNLKLIAHWATRVRITINDMPKGVSG